MKKFYTHLVEIESIIVELDKLDLSPDEKRHLASLMDENLHHTILEAILSELDEEHKRLFVEHLRQNDHDKIWEFLNEKVDSIEEKIKRASEGLKKELLEDIKEAKEK
jgi:hypothetical protein